MLSPEPQFKETIMAPLSIHPVILCGGSGTRLWPRSRAAKPKPFLPMLGETTLFQAALGRAAPKYGFAPPLVVTGVRHVEHVEAQLGDMDSTIVVEPRARNTAAAIALAALRLDPDSIMLVCPSDHHIADAEAFRAAVRAAAALAAEGISVKMLSGTRSNEEQRALYAIGRTTQLGKRKVTNANAGHSNHNFGIAFDLGLFRDGDYLDDNDKSRADMLKVQGTYEKLAEIAAQHGFEWGGDWVNFQDIPHFQMRPDWAEGMSERDMLAAFRERQENGQDPFGDPLPS